MQKRQTLPLPQMPRKNKMYKVFIPVFLAAMLLSTYHLKAQLYTGAEGITIKNGTTFSSEGLVLQPSEDLTLDNLLAQKSATAATTASGNSIMRVYYFNRQLTFTGTAGIYYQDNELNGNTPTKLVLFHKNQFADNEYGTVAGSSSDVANKYVSQNFSLLTFSHITVADNVGALPVSLISFTAKVEGNYAKLQWQTTQEVNNKGFEIWRKGERWEGGTSTGPVSVEGFIKIGEVGSQTPYALNPTLYTFLDKNPLIGNNYYKLVQVDNDGKSHDYGVRLVSFKIATAISAIVFPNPVTGNVINVKLNNYQDKTVTFILTDILGKTLYKKTFDNKQNTTDYTLQLGFKPVAAQYMLAIKGEELSERVKIVVL